MNSFIHVLGFYVESHSIYETCLCWMKVRKASSVTFFTSMHIHFWACQILTCKLSKIMAQVQWLFICHCVEDLILAYCPRMKSEVVSHFMFGSLFGQKLSKFITLILCITKWDYVVKIWAIHSVVHKNKILPPQWYFYLQDEVITINNLNLLIWF